MAAGGDVGDIVTRPQVGEPDAEGFVRLFFDDGSWNTIYRGVRARKESHAVSRVRIETSPDRGNSSGALHGGFMLAFLDHALFLGPIVSDRLPFGRAVTLNLASQFIGAGQVGSPLDCVIEIVGETGRLMFLQGRLEQGKHVVMTYQATLRKFSAPAG